MLRKSCTPAQIQTNIYVNIFPCFNPRMYPPTENLGVRFSFCLRLKPTSRVSGTSILTDHFGVRFPFFALQDIYNFCLPARGTHTIGLMWVLDNGRKKILDLEIRSGNKPWCYTISLLYNLEQVTNIPKPQFLLYHKENNIYIIRLL